MPAPVLISSVPNFVTREEHTAIVGSTPVSFNDIPSILRHKEDNVSVTLEPALEGFSAEDGAKGTLYIIESALVFMSTTGRGFQIGYPNITLHAVSRAESGPSIYCQLGEDVPDTEIAELVEEESGGVDELIIVPQNESSLEPIFEALSHCASMHPDKLSGPDGDLDEAFVDGDRGFFDTFTGDETQELSEVGRAALAHMESIIYDPHEHVQDFKENPDFTEKPDFTTNR